MLWRDNGYMLHYHHALISLHFKIEGASGKTFWVRGPFLWHFLPQQFFNRLTSLDLRHAGKGHFCELCTRRKLKDGVRLLSRWKMCWGVLSCYGTGDQVKCERRNCWLFGLFLLCLSCVLLFLLNGCQHYAEVWSLPQPGALYRTAILNNYYVSSASKFCSIFNKNI